MVIMSKKKPQNEEIEGEEPKQISIKLPDDVRAALHNYRESFKVKPGRTDTIVVALQEFLKREGFYPPDPEE